MNTLKKLTKSFSKKVKQASKKPKTISIDQIRNSSLLNFNVTSDLYRIDLGLLIERPAIFLPFHDTEIEKLNLDSDFYFKHNLRYPIDKSLMEFNKEDPLREYKSKDPANYETHLKINEDGSREFYYKNSKLYENTDPNMEDPQSIQYAPFNAIYLILKHKDGDWCLPYRTLENRESIEICMSRLKNGLLGGNLLLKEKEDFPVGAMVHNVEKEEVEKNKILTRLEGRKVFLYTSYHFTGDISVEDEDDYEDFRWVSKGELNKYLSKENYERVIHLTSRF